MHEMIETIAILFSVGLIFSVPVGFVLFMWYINRKEKVLWAKYGRDNHTQGDTLS